MTIDPVDDCTFWYTNEYYVTSGYATWNTRIGTLSFPGCAQNSTTTLRSTACTTTFTAGQPFTTSAAVTPGTATGTVDFGDGQGGTLCGAVTLAGGVATCTTSSLSAGTYSLGVTYTATAATSRANRIRLLSRCCRRATSFSATDSKSYPLDVPRGEVGENGKRGHRFRRRNERPK